VATACELQITLTLRSKENGRPFPMCGVPYHAAENYLSKLLCNGFKSPLRASGKSQHSWADTIWPFFM
jgi:DNA mismatch repair ATPase MutS